MLPLLWRRHAPVAVLSAVLATSALYELAVDGPGQPLPYTGQVVVHAIAGLPIERVTGERYEDEACPAAF
ncbi:hypothetical protein [Streptomyces sp. NPDC001970]